MVLQLKPIQHTHDRFNEAEMDLSERNKYFCSFEAYYITVSVEYSRVCIGFIGTAYLSVQELSGLM